MIRIAVIGLLAVGAGCNQNGNNGLPDMTTLLPIGSPCTASTMCGPQPAFFCAKDHPGGYCKRDCKVDGDCPTGAICAFDGAVGACHKKCDVASDCRTGEGYECKPASTDPDTLASHAYCDAVEGTDDAGTTGDAGVADLKTSG